MNGIKITTDEWVFWAWDAWPAVKLNATIVFSWLVMALLALGSWLITRRLATSTDIPRLQNIVEVLVTSMRDQIRDVSRQDPGRYLPFVGTLFLFIAVANLLTVVPGYRPPTGSLSTTAALATCVFVAVPLYGIASRGLLGYFKQYIQPSVFMLPFNILGELSRTLALAVRLRQHDERNGDRCDPDRIRAVVRAHSDAAVRSVDRHDPGLHLRGVGDGLYRFGHSSPSGGQRGGDESGYERPPQDDVARPDSQVEPEGEKYG